ncbi:MAG TPA: AbrB/MazE/SpoVT family DNA-binding domain-containing protein [Candidatus Saccharimonadales bacterium]|jgi:AbrB family looped-hinge helix DNA binding protein
MQPIFHGSTSVSDKGQVVIPAEAREAFGLKRGDKLMVFGGRRGNVLMLVKPDYVQNIINRLNEDMAQPPTELEENE